MKAKNIKWETDGEIVDLPTEVNLPDGIVDTTCCEDWKNCDNNSESVNNYLSDTYGWLVEDYNIEDEEEIPKLQEENRKLKSKLNFIEIMLSVYDNKTDHKIREIKELINYIQN